MNKIKKSLKKYSNPNRAKSSASFFKTGKDEYGEGDIFIGISVPEQRTLVKRLENQTSISDIQELLNSKIHEERSISLLLLIRKYEKADGEEKSNIFNFYMRNSKKINNWDLVDLSAPKIVGDYLLNKRNHEVLIKLAKSEDIWERRISIVATFAFIKKNQFKNTLKISKILLKDSHDLINKAVGWMLREVGKRDRKLLEDFLKENYSDLSRTTLRYAIEKFPEELRLKFLNATW